MFETIWMCTHEWSLIWSLTTAFTFETCHQALICESALTLSMTRRSFRFPRTGTRSCIGATASAGVSRASATTSAAGTSTTSFRLGFGRHGVSLEAREPAGATRPRPPSRRTGACTGRVGR